MLTLLYITIFPEYFYNYFNISLAQKINKKKLINYQIYNIRDFANKRKVDDYPFGGGCGMLLKIEPIINTISSIQQKYTKTYIILLSPQGKRFTQKDVPRLIKKENLIFICGRYEGIDARLFNFVDEQLSIGDFVTMGGEIPALIITDAIIRGVFGAIKKKSYQNESFTNNRYDFDSFTYPRVFKNLPVPDILLSGNHKQIELWKKKNIEEKINNPKKNYQNKNKKKID